MSESLADRQAAFMRAILDENAPLPQGWGNSQAAGMGVYRGNYRGALMGTLEATFERTRRYVGEGPFRRAGAHHLLGNPPSGWTIDDAGKGFAETCAELFGENPEVAELAWLEWAMQDAATGPDIEPLTGEDLGRITADFDDDQWMNLRVEFQPRSTARLVQYNCTALWPALDADGLELPDISLPGPRGCIVWREGERPTFMGVDPDNAQAFAGMQGGASYSEIIGLLAGENPEDDDVQDAAMRAGAMLGGWLNEGLVTALKT